MRVKEVNGEWKMVNAKLQLKIKGYIPLTFRYQPTPDHLLIPSNDSPVMAARPTDAPIPHTRK